MVVRASITVAVLTVSLLAGTTVAPGATQLPELALTRVADLGGLTAFATRTGDRTLYVAEQEGRVRAVRRGRAVERPVLDISGDVRAGGEPGLLGLAFSPDGTTLYVNYTNSADGGHRVDEFAMSGRVADPATRRTVLALDDPQPNHNGGQLAFGPDGHLYIAMGDGGGGNDEGSGHARGGNGQSLETLLGKILRIDPTPSGDAGYTVPADNPFLGRDDALPEIWAYGLRNPWRFSFDARTGDLWIGDVGQNAVEEVDFAPAVGGRDAGKGANFGWNRLEGNDELRGRAPDGAVAPVATHSHDEGWRSVIGGYVYRGSRITPLQGTYVYTDYYAGDVVGLQPDGAGGFTPVDLGLDASNVSAFGEAPNGELYLLSQSDGLLRLVRA
jgi:glucose/arabinose dehydrogenase